MTLSPAYGGSSPGGGASHISLPLWGRWHAKRDGEGISREANTPTNPNLKVVKPSSSCLSLTCPMALREAFGGRSDGGSARPACLSLTRPTALHQSIRREKRQGLGVSRVSFSNPPMAMREAFGGQSGRVSAVPDAYEGGTLEPCKGGIRPSRVDRPALYSVV